MAELDDDPLCPGVMSTQTGQHAHFDLAPPRLARRLPRRRPQGDHHPIVRDHRAAPRGRGRSERLGSLAPRACSSGLGLFSPLDTVQPSALVVCCLARSWHPCRRSTPPRWPLPCVPQAWAPPQQPSTPLCPPCRTPCPSSARGWKCWRHAAHRRPRRPTGPRPQTRQTSTLATDPHSRQDKPGFLWRTGR